MTMLDAIFDKLATLSHMSIIVSTRYYCLWDQTLVDFLRSCMQSKSKVFVRLCSKDRVEV